MLYLTMSDIDETSGVYKKVMAQSEAYVEFGYECKILFVRDSGCASLLDVKSKTISDINLKDRESICLVHDYINMCTFCYARFELLRHRYYRKIISYCHHVKVKIISEIPTYPPYQESIARAKAMYKKRQYIHAMKTMLGTFLVLCDMYVMTIYSNIVIIIADDKKFRFAKTLRIENGIDLKTNPFQPLEYHDVINVIAVSNFSVWNGYDRAILGLKNYINATGKHDIKLIMVGDTAAGKDLIMLADKLGIMDDIEFRGALSGKELDFAYSESQIALGALGNHRRKVFENSSLKAKEYASRGMLMILSDAEGIDKEMAAASFIVKSDETPIDFESIKEWFVGLDNREDLRLKLRKHAETDYSWTNQILKIIKCIEAN